MEEEKREVLIELLQNASHVAKLIISSEIAMNDGEIVSSQKYTKEAQSTLKTMVVDVFCEIEENFGVSYNESNDYDTASMLELAKALTAASYDASVLLGLEGEQKNDALEGVIKKQLSKDIATIIEIYNAIFNN